jgi:hypothetical protein
LTWSGNQLDLTNPTIEPGQTVMLPGGHREYRQWVVPTIPRGIAGVSSNLYGAGTCTGGYEGAYGTGGFVWPADNHTLSGNDYWSGHLAIDIAAGEGAGIYAADSGVVVFAGGALGGYGNMCACTVMGTEPMPISVQLELAKPAFFKVVISAHQQHRLVYRLHCTLKYATGRVVCPWFVLIAP